MMEDSSQGSIEQGMVQGKRSGIGVGERKDGRRRGER